MSFGEADAQTWIDRGSEAYRRLHIAEAAQNFERAVAIDPHSVQARLCFGVACLFLYQNGVSEVHARFLDPDSISTPFESEVPAELDRIRSLIAEQNSTNGKRAEENLQQALRLEPRNTLAMAYLAALYYAWSDPPIGLWRQRPRSRLADAQHWYQRVLEIDPHHNFANYVCGVIDWQKAFELLRFSGSYPRPLMDEELRRSLHAQIAPLIEDGTRNLMRSLEIDPDNWYPMSYLSLLKRAQAYVAGTNEEYLRASSEADEWNRKIHRSMEAKARAAGQPWPPGETAMITSHSAPQTSQPTGKVILPPFPPDPQRMIPLGLPPLPPAIER